MPKMILYTATSDIHLKMFHFPYLKLLHDKECDIDIAYEKRGSTKFPLVGQEFRLPFKRNPFCFSNIKAFFILRKLIQQKKYDIIHCHTPVVAVLTRFAAVSARNNPTIMYTAHGYHFFKGAPVRMWMVFYPVEYLLSYLTDVIITMNEEDYKLTIRKFKNRHTFYINGMGVNADNFKDIKVKEISKLRTMYKYNTNEYILIYVAEFIARKNHEFLISSLPTLKNEIAQLKIVFIGTGVLFQEMQELAERLKVDDVIDFLGWRDDVNEYLAISDVAISASKQEGMPIGLAEAMSTGLPLVASLERGHKELIHDGINGYMYDQGDYKQFTDYILRLYNDKDLRIAMGKRSKELAKQFSLENALKSMDEIYSKFL